MNKKCRGCDLVVGIGCVNGKLSIGIFFALNQTVEDLNSGNTVIEKNVNRS